MVEVTWTHQALDDLKAICQFIARDSAKYAHLIANRIFEVVDRLEQFPDSGRTVPEINKKNIREVICGSYRIIYRLSKTEAEILTVFHGSKLFNSFMVSK